MNTLLENSIVGERFGHLVVIGPSFNISRFVKGSRRHELFCVCQCDCGALVAMSISKLRTRARVCTIHCKLRHPKPRGPSVDGVLYQVWNGMRQRCHNPNTRAYRNYGGRGIRVCREWLQCYALFEVWALANGWRKELEIDRRDNDGNYEPDNCRFVDRATNCRNRRTTRMITAFGETKTAMEWAGDSRCVVSPQLLSRRIRDGWVAEEAIAIAKASSADC